MKLGINYKDNDFYNTFHAIVKILLEFNNHLINPSFNKETIALIVNEIVTGMYLFTQSRGTDLDISESFRSYLKISPSDIYINDEVDVFLSEKRYDHSFIWFDTDLDWPNNNPIQCA